MDREYPLPGDRATFYVPATRWHNDTTDPREGRRLMFMRDLACCADGKTSYSTPSDLVRFALATHVDSVDGELARGSVMSLRKRHGLVVAVASNIAYANTAAIAVKVAEVFDGPPCAEPLWIKDGHGNPVTLAGAYSSTPV